MNNLLAKQFIIDQIKKDNPPHRKIANRMARQNFGVSFAVMKNELIEEGIIIVEKTARLGANQKINYYFKLTNKELNKVQMQKSKTKSNFWDDGTPKSTGNAFDLSTAKGLFNKAEIAASQNKGKPTNYNAQVQVIAYSRA